MTCFTSGAGLSRPVVPITTPTSSSRETSSGRGMNQISAVDPQIAQYRGAAGTAANAPSS